ncbi:MAG: hypothetical protein R8M38_02165 [Mariprofundaceae bacterium]
MSGDWLPHSGAFLGWNFGTWNHHGSHSSLKMHSKWDCHSSTQRFACGSDVTQSSIKEFGSDVITSQGV